MTRLIAMLAATLTSFFIAGAAQAHPHVWITMKSTVVYAPDGSAIGVRQAWTFDDMYSAFAVQGLDQKVKGQFTREELQPLAQINVESLKEYDYFTYANANGGKALFTDPVEYHLESKDAILTLHFLLPFKAPLKAKALTVEVYDPGYFIEFSLAEKDAVALANAPSGCQLSVAKPQDMTKEMADKLAQIPPDGKIPADSFGAAFANKINVRCP